MRKFQNLLLVLMFLFTLPMITGCGEEQIRVSDVSFTQGTYTVVQGDTIQLETDIIPIEANNQSVTYKILSGSNYITISNSGVVTAKTSLGSETKTAQVQVITDDGKMTASCYVNVIPTIIALEAPTNLIYNASSSTISWDVVTHTENNFSASYTLSITKDGGEPTIITDTRVRSYSITDSGSYVVKVKSLGNGDVFSDSEYTTDYNFTILATPQTPTISNGVITVNKIVTTGYDTDKDDYQLIVTRANSTTPITTTLTKTETDTTVSWDIPYSTSDILASGTYEYKVRLLGDGGTTDTDVTYFKSEYSSLTGATFTQLGYVTNLLIANGAITWTGVTNATKYSVYVYTTDLNNPEFTYNDITTNSWTLSEDVLNLETYVIKVRAMGNGGNILSGLMSTKASQKLGTPTNLSISDKTVTWDAVTNASTYSVFLNASTIPISTNSALSYTFEDTEDFQVGTNTIKVVAGVSDASSIYVSSDAGTLSVTKLAIPTLSTNSGNIAWSSVSNVTQYTLSLTQTGYTKQTYTLSNATLTYALGDTYSAGIYLVSVQAKGNGTDILDSDDAEEQQYTKMTAPTIASVSESGLLTWTKGTYASSSNTFNIIIRDPTGESDDIVLSTTGLSYSVGQYLTGSGYGEYYFIVKAVNNVSTQKYLTSTESTAVTTYKLDAPTTLAISNGMLAWTGISNTIEDVDISSKFDYKIKIDTDETQTTGNTFLVPSSASCYAGTHTAWVQARVLSTVSNQITVGEVTAFLIGSDYSTSFSFTKLASLRTPTISDEIVSGTGLSGITSYTLTIEKPSNEQRTYNVTAVSNSWSTTVSDIFNNIGTVETGTYKISAVANGENSAVTSDQSSTLTIYKLASPTISVADGEVEWNIVYSNLYNNRAPITSYEIEIRSLGTTDWISYIPDAGETSWSMTNYVAGEYEVRITANGSSSRILTSQPSDVITVEKLDNIDIDTLAVDLSDIQYNTLTWDAVGDASYQVSIYQVYPTINVLKETTEVNTNIFEFSDDYAVNDYLIGIQSVANGKVSGDMTTLFNVTRLQQVTGINVQENGDIIWDSVTDANKYLMYINNEIIPDSQVNSITRVAKLLSGSNPILTSNDTGTLSIQIIAVIDGENASTPTNGNITISGAPSVKYNVFRYDSVTLSVTNGQIVWNNTNANNFGYELTFTSGGLPTTIDIAQNVSNYNMSALSAATTYAVSIKALGNGGIYLESPTSDLANSVQKLAEPTYSVVDGRLSWTKDTNAKSYKAVTNGSNKTVTTIDLKPLSSTPTIVTLPTSSLTGMSGVITFTIQAIGTASIIDTGTVYVNSTVTTTNTVYKHATPTGLMVLNGEIAWTRATSKETVVNSSTYTILNGYNVIYGENNRDVGESDLNEAFVLSNYITTQSALAIQVCALGNDGNNSSPTGTVYLNSDYTSTMNVTINGRPENLGITDGVLTWTENAQITGNFSDYEILVVQSGFETPTSILSTTNSNSLDTLSGTFTSIQVRHKGTVSSASSGTKYVNSATSTAITNVKKLSTINAEVNTDGEFKWNASDFVFTGFTAGITFTVNDVSNETTGTKSTESVFTLDGDYGEDVNSGASVLSINGYAVGSEDISNTDSAGYCYLNSVDFDLSAYRFAPVTSFTVKDGLKLAWTVDGYVMNGVKNDRFMIEYKLGENAGNSSADWNVKIVDDLSEIPLWTLGYYEVRISVLSTSANVIKSLAVNCENTEETPYLFNKFEDGDGTPENPFIISTTTESATVEASTAETKLGYIDIIPSSYFLLTEDIVLTEKTNTIDEIYVTNLRSTLSAENNNVTITGGINGNGHTISNYQIYSDANDAYLWYGLEGDTREGFIGTPSASNFYGRSGIIFNLNLEVSKFNMEIDTNAQYIISFFTLTSLGGWILNCNINTAGTLSDISFDGIENDYNIIYGGFVGYMFDTNTSADIENSEKIDRDARIMNCTSDINISLTKATGYLNSSTLLGGIAGYNFGGTIYNCTNTGNLGGTQVAGIAVGCGKVDTYNEVNAEWILEEKVALISGCTNSGNLTSYPIKTSDGDEHRSYSGGIVGSLQYGNLVYCINTGNLTAVSGNCHASNQDFQQTIVVMGGLVGQFDNGVIVNCISTASITIGDYISLNSMSESGGSSQLGGLIGNKSSGKFEYCYYDKTISNLTEVGGVIGNNSGRETTELKTEAFVTNSFLSDPSTDEKIDYYYDVNFGVKPVFIYMAGSYPELSWVEI